MEGQVERLEPAFVDLRLLQSRPAALQRDLGIEIEHERQVGPEILDGQAMKIEDQRF